MGNTMRHLILTSLIASLLVACGPSAPPEPDPYQSLNENIETPGFVRWFNQATPYAKRAFFVSICLGEGFRRNTVDFNLCVNNTSKRVNVHVRGRL